MIGLHGTNDESVIGEDVSTGSIAMTNDDMLELEGTLPLGTARRDPPVRLVARTL